MRRITFTTLCDTDARRSLSVVHVSNDKLNVEFAKNHSLHDTRMGAFFNVPCGTCGKSDRECPGHFGHIELQEPVLIPSVRKSGLLREVLEKFCLKCFRARCLCRDSDEERSGKRRRLVSRPVMEVEDGAISFEVVKEEAPAPCVGIYAKLTKNVCARSPLRYSIVWAHDPTTELTLRALYVLLKQIPREEMLNEFPHTRSTNIRDVSEMVFMKYLLVVPLNHRRPNEVGGAWVSDSLTLMYGNVMKKNREIRTQRAFPHTGLIDEVHVSLQSAVDVIYDSNDRRAIGRNSGGGPATSGFRQRVDGKYGRLRRNLMGKRVDFSARTVLSGDPRLGINEVGIPQSIADTLTVPVVVNQYNIRGITTRHRIKYVTTKRDGKRYDLAFKQVILNIGDIVERSLENGDIVAVNRQPTLHRGSIVACYVRIFPCSTFRLNYSTMVTLNADTDGDEINVHVPQDLEARAELEELMLASTNIVSSQSSKPLIGLTQDSLLGSYKLSKAFLTREDFMSILYELDITDEDFDAPDVLKPVRLWAGTRVLTNILESLGVYIEHYEKKTFEIVDNRVVSGVLNKDVMGATDHSIAHTIYLDYGHKVAAKFIHMMQTAATAFLDIVGFSVGVGDCCIKDKGGVHVDFDALEDHLVDKFFETGGKWSEQDEGALTGALGELTKLDACTDGEDNALLDMIQSGAKGSLLNFNQITRLVGQQTTEDGRIPKGFYKSGRTLPHYSKFDPTAGPRGLVKNSFIKGLTPQEFYFHAMGGRTGLIDTAIKTAITGDHFRKLIKTTESIVVKDSGDGERMVFNQATGRVIQFNYGENGIDALYEKK